MNSVSFGQEQELVKRGKMKEVFQPNIACNRCRSSEVSFGIVKLVLNKPLRTCLALKDYISLISFEPILIKLKCSVVVYPQILNCRTIKNGKMNIPNRFHCTHYGQVKKQKQNFFYTDKKTF